MKNYKINSSLVCVEEPKAWAYKLGTDFMIFIILEKMSIIRFNTSVLLRTVSNPVNVNYF